MHFRNHEFILILELTLNGKERICSMDRDGRVVLGRAKGILQDFREIHGDYILLCGGE